MPVVATAAMIRAPSHRRTSRSVTRLLSSRSHAHGVPAHFRRRPPQGSGIFPAGAESSARPTRSCRLGELFKRCRTFGAAGFPSAVSRVRVRAAREQSARNGRIRGARRRRCCPDCNCSASPARLLAERHLLCRRYEASSRSGSHDDRIGVGDGDTRGRWTVGARAVVARAVETAREVSGGGP